MFGLGIFNDKGLRFRVCFWDYLLLFRACWGFVFPWGWIPCIMAHSLLYVDALAGKRTEVEIWDWLYGWGSCLFKATSYLSPLKPPKKTQKILKWPLISSAWGEGPEELKENDFLFLYGKYSLAERLSRINQFSPVWSIVWVKGNNLSSVPFRPGSRLGVSGSFSSGSCASGSPRYHLQMAGPFSLGEGSGNQQGWPRGK